MGIVVSLLSGSIGAGLMTILLAMLQRHWAKKDAKTGKLEALVNAQKVVMVDRVRYLGSRYIKQKSVSLEDKETLIEMYNAYKALGGNGHLETVMQEVEKLPVTE